MLGYIAGTQTSSTLVVSSAGEHTVDYFAQRRELSSWELAVCDCHPCAPSCSASGCEQDMLEHPVLPAERAVALLLPAPQRPAMVAPVTETRQEAAGASRSNLCPATLGCKQAELVTPLSGSHELALSLQLKQRAMKQLWSRQMRSRRQAQRVLLLSGQSHHWTPSPELMRRLCWMRLSTITGLLVNIVVSTCHRAARALGD
jgi:hypothetical protein